MTEREIKVKQYYVSKGIFYALCDEEQHLMDLAKEFLGLMGAVWTRGKTDDVSGISDLLICYSGQYIAVELKDDIGMPTPQQNKFINDVLKAGGKAAVCRTLSDIFDLLIS